MPVPSAALPPAFLAWFAGRGWAPRPHQLALLAHAEAGRSALLIAPTGAGKTLAGFLPSLVELSSDPKRQPGLHTLYVSPLKALSVDVARNLDAPVAEMGLGIRIETRTGDTSASKRQRQRRDPPDILLTTPEQIALLLANPKAREMFATLKRIVLDELHALVTSKRGDLLALDLARLRRLAPGVQTVGLSATVREPRELVAYLHGRDDPLPAVVTAPEGAAAHITMLDSKERLPWAGHSARHALKEIYDEIRRVKLALLFVNTRFQAEQLFWDLWRINADNLPIALHHGSLDVGQRRKVEDAMAEGRLKAVVATATLDLGIDWGDVDLVVNVGAPKGASRLIQRIGRANHRLDEASRAILVPANRFEVLECRAAITAAADGAQDTPVPRSGALDVLAQHVLGMACAEPFAPDAFFAEVTDAAPYADLSPRGLRPRRAVRRPWRLRAPGLRALRQDPADRGRAVARFQWQGRPAVPHERRHHRAGRHAEGQAGAVPGGVARDGWRPPSRAFGPPRPARSAAVGGCWARSRTGSSKRCCRATLSCSAARSWRCRPSWTTRRCAPAPAAPSPRSLPTRAPSSPSPPIWPTRCGP